MDTAADVQAALLAEIHRPDSTRASIALWYARAITAKKRYGSDAINWEMVNGEILDYYQPSGLMWIKKWAWKFHRKGRSK